MAAWTREDFAERAHRCCEYCRLPDFVDPHNAFHLEHIVARQHGGGDEPDNLAWARGRCNLRKGPNLSSIDPESQAAVALYHPRRDRWNSHFTIQNERIVGLTPTARATARLLDMNNVRRIELRLALIERGLWHVSPR
jgi:hypothetical protein